LLTRNEFSPGVFGRKEGCGNWPHSQTGYERVTLIVAVYSLPSGILPRQQSRSLSLSGVVAFLFFRVPARRTGLFANFTQAVPDQLAIQRTLADAQLIGDLAAMSPVSCEQVSDVPGLHVANRHDLGIYLSTILAGITSEPLICTRSGQSDGFVCCPGIARQNCCQDRIVAKIYKTNVNDKLTGQVLYASA
jgi:hypothetical protein